MVVLIASRDGRAIQQRQRLPLVVYHYTTTPLRGRATNISKSGPPVRFKFSALPLLASPHRAEAWNPTDWRGQGSVAEATRPSCGLLPEERDDSYLFPPFSRVVPLYTACPHFSIGSSLYCTTEPARVSRHAWLCFSSFASAAFLLKSRESKSSLVWTAALLRCSECFSKWPI